MSKVTYEEVKESYKFLIEDDFGETEATEMLTDDSKKDLINFIEQHRPPTLEEVLNAWRNVEPQFKYRDKAVDKNGIRFIFPNGIIYEINTEQVYSNKKVFSMNVEQSLKAINLTVEYLKNRQIIESDKATK